MTLNKLRLWRFALSTLVGINVLRMALSTVNGQAFPPWYVIIWTVIVLGSVVWIIIITTAIRILRGE